ncbi:hypothetical protein [Streptomyces sp. NPDC054866]
MTNAKDTGTRGQGSGGGGAAPLPTRLTVDLLDSCLQKAGQSFEPGELAYLALTSQVENPVRDRVAFQMHRRFEGTRLDVGREWTGMFAEGRGGQRVLRKVDLALVERPRRRPRYVQPPKAVVEFKAVHSYAAYTKGHLNRIERLVRADVLKSVSWEGCILGDVYAVLLLPHVTVLHERKLAAHVMKGHAEIDWRCWLQQVDGLRYPAIDGITARLAPLGPVREGLIDGGTEYGCHVTVPYLILGPVGVETFETLEWPL